MTDLGVADPLGRLESGLESLLSRIEAEGDSTPEGVVQAFSGVTAAFDAVRESLSTSSAREEHQGRVGKCLRLYAVAVNTLLRQREQLASGQKSCDEVLGRLNELHRGETRGVSCDVRG